jgi:D-alanyl-lipoteichoic acid acyltransferase DltB (MBOAT superfamily)
VGVLFSYLVVGAYVLLGRWLVRSQWHRREAAFALLTLAVVFLLFFATGRAYLYFALYVSLVVIQYLALRSWGKRSDWLAWGAFLTPIAFLILLKYIPPSAFVRLSPALRNTLQNKPAYQWSVYFIGLSYLAFRTSSLAVEVRTGLVKQPGFWDYLGFAFFVPCMSVGPITRYSQYHRGFTPHDRPEIPVAGALLRILVGAVKFAFLAPLLEHHWMNWVVAMLVYYPFLYCNFSGFCDMAIGCAGLMGIPMQENFDNPFAARNMKELWNRWHISLSLWMRDYVFTPLSKTLVRAFGPAAANHAIAITIVVVFLLVGVWHGVGWNFVLFGAMNAVGVAANHYYTVALKQGLGKERFAAYNRNKVIRAVAVAITFVYFSASMIFFVDYGGVTARILNGGFLRPLKLMAFHGQLAASH